MRTGGFALLFEFDRDVKKIRHVLYNCSASRPKIESKTNDESREVQTETLTVKARPLASGYVKAKTGDTTTAAVYDDLYKSVYTPATTEPEPTAVASFLLNHVLVNKADLKSVGKAADR